MGKCFMKDLIKESRRWSAQAEDDYRFVVWVRTEDGFYDKVCFLTQQAGEKILKACLYATGKRKVWGHSLGEMILELSEIDPIFKKIVTPAKRLDRFYISARYPNGLPGLSPFQAYSKEDSDDAWEDLKEVFAHCRIFLEKSIDTSEQTENT